MPHSRSEAPRGLRTPWRNTKPCYKPKSGERKYIRSKLVEHGSHPTVLCIEASPKLPQ
jgi:hypothetical protein